MVLDGTAVRAGSSHKEEALAFLDFTVSRDAQKIMAVSRNRRSVRTDTSCGKRHGSDGKAAASGGRKG